MITNAVYESGEKVDYTYDSLDRLTGEKYTDVHGEVISEDRYEYDLTGTRTKKTVLDSDTNALITVNYALSTGNRLASWSVAETNLLGRVDLAGYASEPVGTNDRFGSLWVSNAVSGAVKPQVAGTNFWAYDLPVGLGTQTLVAAIRDMAGNMGYATNTILLTVVTNGTYQHNAACCVTNIAYRGKDYSQTLGLTWDGQYQLTAAATNGVAVERYGHDAFGRRVWTWDAANGTNWHVYDGPHVIADLNATGGVVRTYVWGPGIDNLLAMTTYGGTTNTYYPLKDHLGSILALTDGAGNIVESYRYDAWGRTTVYDASGNPLSASAVGNRYCWQGREYSWKTGLYFFRARWYDPVTGRWLSNDPIGISGGLNQYVFCANNPVNFGDPFGLCEDSEPSLWDQFWLNVYEDVSGQSPGFVTYGLTETHSWIGQTRHESAMWWLEEGPYGLRNIGAFTASMFDERSYAALTGGAAVAPWAARTGPVIFNTHGPHKGLGPHGHYGPRHPGSNQPMRHIGPENPSHGSGPFRWSEWFRKGMPWRWK
jgi:RHS repeat-associated protein